MPSPGPKRDAELREGPAHHNLPHKLRTELGAISSHEIATAFTHAEAGGFEVLVTADQGLGYQQNLDGRRLAVVVLSANNWPILANYIPTILAAIERASAGSFELVECGDFSRKRADDAL